jgi:hypothetical protein
MKVRSLRQRRRVATYVGANRRNRRGRRLGKATLLAMAAPPRLRMVQSLCGKSILSGRLADV